MSWCYGSRIMKKIIASLFLTSLLGGCFVHTGPSYSRRGPCPAGYTKENGVCRERRNGHHDNGNHNGVVVRDHRR